ncbi:helix-turn-helix domain-containing protein [Lacrimispora brassicae]
MKLNDKKIVDKTIGDMIKHMRVTEGLSQKTLGEKINKTESTISVYELEKSSFPFTSFHNIAKTCDFEILLYDKDTEEIFRIIDSKKDKK